MLFNIYIIALLISAVLFKHDELGILLYLKIKAIRDDFNNYVLALEEIEEDINED